MSEFKIQMPKLGESVQEATITKWFVKEGDKIEEDQSLFEVATDKVDSEIPSPVDGIIKKIFFEVNALVPVGETVVIITTDDDDESDNDAVIEEVESDSEKTTEKEPAQTLTAKSVEKEVVKSPEVTEPESVEENNETKSTRFYSPLVQSIAKSEQVSLSELESIKGSGLSGRVQKSDILSYVQARKEGKVSPPVKTSGVKTEEKQEQPKISASLGSGDQIIEMDRVRKIIADHMVMSKKVSPHVTSVVEADVTNLVLWRTRIRDDFSAKYGEKITYMPIFTEAVARAITEYPLLNSSVDDYKIIIHKDVN
ncbi:MAG: biotin/lipoyl-containing protein, partial [Bacteroidota bacterium]|nr:biotin/lipoyl-containing protein [Bacteroidota bacterium]